MSDTDALTQIDAMRGVVALRVGHRQRRRPAGPHRGRQDRHLVRLQGRLVRRLHAAARHRRLGGLRQAGALDGEGLQGRAGVRRHVPGRDLPRLHAAGAEGRGARSGFPLSPGVQQNSYTVDIRRDPYVLAPIGLQGRARADHGASTTGRRSRRRTASAASRSCPTWPRRSARRPARWPTARASSSSGSTSPPQPGQTVDRVVDQVPEPGVQVPIGDPVRVFIAKDVPLVRVPGRRPGSTSREAVARLQAVKFRVVIEDGATQEGARPGRGDRPGHPRRRAVAAAVGDHAGRGRRVGRDPRPRPERPDAGQGARTMMRQAGPAGGVGARQRRLDDARRRRWSSTPTWRRPSGAEGRDDHAADGPPAKAS